MRSPDTETSLAETADDSVPEQITPPGSAIFNTKQLMEMLDLEVTPDFVTELARDHRIPAFKAGARWRFRSEDIGRIRQEIRKYLERQGG